MLDPNHPDLLATINNLAGLYDSMGKYAEAEVLFKECLEKQRTVLDPNHPDLLTTMNNYGSFLRDIGLLDESEVMLTECVEKSTAALGAHHPLTLRFTDNFGYLLVKRGPGRWAEAEGVLSACLQAMTDQPALGEDHAYTQRVRERLAELHTLMKQS